MNFRPVTSLNLAVPTLVIVGCLPTSAAPFVFNKSLNPPSVLLGLRQSGNPLEIVVNLGPVSQFKGALPGQSFQITNIPPAEITKIFSTLDNLSLTAFASIFDPTATNPPNSTLYISKSRGANIGTQSSPWLSRLAAAQVQTVTAMGTIGGNANKYSLTVPDGPDNNGILVVERANANTSYSTLMTTQGNFGNKFPSRVETYTPIGFSLGTTPTRADFYEIPPDGASAVYLGYFDFSPDATLKFTADGGVVAGLPPVLSIERNGTVNSVSFLTQSGPYQYTLLRAPSANVTNPLAQWITVGSPVSGTGSNVTLTDTDDSGASFYRVQVNP